MDDLKGIIYVVGVIIWLVYSYVSRKNKRDAQKAPKGNPSSKENKDFSTVLDEILKEAKSKQTQKNTPQQAKPAEVKPAAQTKYNIPEPPEPGKGGYEFGHYDTLEEIVDEEAEFKDFGTEKYEHETLEEINTEQKFEFKDEEHLKASKDEHYSKESEYDEAFDFDMEKAIIFSEVLARPKF